jgi:hypothetical protein
MAGITGRQLSRLTGFSETYVSHQLHARKRMSPVLRAVIVALLGLPEEELFHQEDQAP